MNFSKLLLYDPIDLSHEPFIFGIFITLLILQ